ncbi:hypothetical protein GOP47_0013713 [Adiantum capillus-veneris]|uniref:Bidirectional sugar transporter SWEET n=1 Tax=Adiantum capillus-veneris TaxID=13818 RepID=A0A9D4UPJ0_ADICA|nr:hypothetical protein GOP47_0013713 [Adiantum capillus-veneris]
MKLAALILGILGNALSMLVFASPMPTFWRILRKRSTESFSAFPYICTLLSNMMWLYYGILDSDGLLLITISASGCAIESLYLSIYMMYASKQQRFTLAKQAVVMLSIYLTILTFTLIFARGGRRLQVVGLLSAFNSLCMYASPLIAVKMVITTRSVEYMPFLLSMSLFLCGGVWFGYALLMKDLYLEISNGSGFCLGFIQLVVYAFYVIIHSKCRASADKSHTALATRSCNDSHLNPQQLQIL